MSIIGARLKAAVPVAVASGIASVFGAAKITMGAHLLVAAGGTASVGPAPHLMRGIADIAVGVVFASAGIALAWRQQWGLILIRKAWPAFALYELGLMLGRALEAGRLIDGVALTLAFVAFIVISGLFANSAACERFVREGLPKSV